MECLTEYKGVVRSQEDGQEPVGFAKVPETVQVIRSELLQEMLGFGHRGEEGQQDPWMSMMVGKTQVFTSFGY